jgi:Serine dehydratase beta chain
MRITYDFYQRCTRLPADQLARATDLKVFLFGSLSATGKGHGTERAALAGIIGKEPATVEPQFLDSLVSNPDQSFPVKLGDKTLNVSLANIVYDSPKGEFPHPNTMTCKLLAGTDVVDRAGRDGQRSGRLRQERSRGHRLHRQAGLGNVERVEVLPFHQMGKFKWERLNLDYALRGVEPPSPETAERACAVFRAAGLTAY